MSRSGFAGAELASVLGVTRGTVSHWLCGRSMPRGQRLVSIAKILGVSVDDLYGTTFKERR